MKKIPTFLSVAVVAALAISPCLQAQDLKALASKASKAVSTAVDRRAAQADLEALIKGAKAETEVTFYSAPTANVAKRIADGFTARYGVKAQFVRLGSSPLSQRFASEAEAGNFAADMLINAGSAVAYAEDGIKKGWLDAISKAGLPVLRGGEFPAKFNTGPTAIVQVSPWLVTYNTNSVKGTDIPKDWPDLLDAKWKGRILVGNPGVSDAYIDFWGLLHDKYGDSFFTLLRANLRPVTTGVQAAQGLGAGEGSFLVPAVVGQVQENKEKGAPLDVVIIPYTTGVEQHLMLAARGKAKHPNAARLLANYLMSPEGNKVMNDEPGGFTVYETEKLPKEYHSPKPFTAARKEQVVKLLGF